MDELIESLKKATGPDPDLDGRIYCAINGLTFRSVSKSGAIHFESKDGTHTMVTPHPYTSSLDTAREVIPKGLYWIAGYGKNSELEPLGGACVFDRNPEQPLAEGEGATEHIAMCIAGLKARQALRR